MTIISSQRYINCDIVDAKIAELTGADSVTLPITYAGMVDGNGNDVYILVDGHHRREAALELGLAIEYETVGNPNGCLTGEALLLDLWVDSDWYDIESGDLVYDLREAA